MFFIGMRLSGLMQRECISDVENALFHGNGKRLLKLTAVRIVLGR